MIHFNYYRVYCMNQIYTDTLTENMFRKSKSGLVIL